jgi:HK97 family phage portal protein
VLVGWLSRRRQVVAELNDAAVKKREVGSVIWQMSDQLTLPQNPLRPITSDALALTNAAVWRCTVIISETIGLLPLDAFRRREGVRQPVDPTPSMLASPGGPLVHRSSWMAQVVLSLLHHGNAYIWLAPPSWDGYPTSGLVVHPERVKWDATRGQFRILTGDGNLFASPWPLGRLLHIPGITIPGQVEGIGVLRAHGRTHLALADVTREYAANTYSAGIPPTYLHTKVTDPTEDEVEALQDRWDERFGPSGTRRGKIPVFTESVEPKTLGWSPTDAGIIEARRMSVDDVAMLFGVPAALLNVPSNSLTYATTVHRRRELVDLALMPWITRIEQSMSSLYPRGTEVKFNVDAFLRADTAERYAAYTAALDGGWLTRDEVRALEDLPPLPETVAADPTVEVEQQ